MGEVRLEEFWSGREGRNGGGGKFSNRGYILPWKIEQTGRSWWFVNFNLHKVCNPQQQHQQQRLAFHISTIFRTVTSDKQGDGGRLLGEWWNGGDENSFTRPRHFKWSTPMDELRLGELIVLYPWLSANYFSQRNSRRPQLMGVPTARWRWSVIRCRFIPVPWKFPIYGSIYDGSTSTEWRANEES